MMYMNDTRHTMRTMTIANARAHLGDVIGRVRHGGDRFVLTSRGKRAVAIVPVEDLDALEAAEDAADVAYTRKVLADVKAGKVKTVPHAAVVAGIEARAKRKAKSAR